LDDLAGAAADGAGDAVMLAGAAAMAADILARAGRARRGFVAGGFGWLAHATRTESSSGGSRWWKRMLGSGPRPTMKLQLPLRAALSCALLGATPAHAG